jgi:hypothetical protein
MPGDKDAQRFGWHIGGHACFQPIMHIVSELDMPDLDAPNRQAIRSRALDALKKTMLTRGREATPMWNAMNRIISNSLAKSTSRHFTVTPFQAAQSDFSVNETLQGLASSATVPGPALLLNMPIPGEFTSSASLPDPITLGSIEMLEPDIMFDWVREPSSPLKQTLPLTRSTRDSGTLILQLLMRIERHCCSACRKLRPAALRRRAVQVLGIPW